MKNIQGQRFSCEKGGGGALKTGVSSKEDGGFYVKKKNLGMPLFQKNSCFREEGFLRKDISLRKARLPLEKEDEIHV